MATITLTKPVNPSARASAENPEFPRGAKAITPSDTDVFDRPATIYVGVAGNVVIRPWNGDAAVTFVGLQAGQVVPCMAIGVNATNTTATSLVAVY